MDLFNFPLVCLKIINEFEILDIDIKIIHMILIMILLL